MLPKVHFYNRFYIYANQKCVLLIFSFLKITMTVWWSHFPINGIFSIHLKNKENTCWRVILIEK